MRTLLFCLAGAFVLIGFFGLFSPHWLQVEPALLSVRAREWGWLRPVQDYVPWLPPSFWPSLFLVAWGGILVAVGIKDRTTSFLGELKSAPLPGLDGSALWAPGARRFWIVAVLAVATLFGFRYFIRPLPALPWVALLAALLGWGYWLDARTGPTRFCSRRELWSAAGLVAFLAVLAGLFRSEPGRWIGTIVVVASVAWAWKRWPQRAALWSMAILFLVSMLYYTAEIRSWRYASIGDEYDFFGLSKDALFFGGRSYLDAHGVYGHHPVSCSFHQYWIELLYGMDVYGWRMSAILCVHAAAIALWIFLRRLVNARAAWVGVAVLLLSNRLLGLSMPGYNQMQGLAAMVGFWAVLIVAIQRGSCLGYVLSGMLAVAGFYTFTMAVPLAAIGGVLWLLSLPCTWSFRLEKTAGDGLRRRVMAPFCLLLLGATAVLLPRFIDLEWLPAQMSLTATDASPEAAGRQRIQNVVQSLLAGGSLPEDSHYASGPLLDPLSALLATGGVFWWLAAGWRTRPGLWLLAAFLLCAVVVGALNVHPFPANTRIFMLIPPAAVAAALGWAAAEHQVGQMPMRRRWLTVPLLALVPVLLGLNWYQLHTLLDRTYPRNFHQYIFKTLEELPQRRPLYVVGRRHEFIDEDLQLAMDAYGYTEKDLLPLDYAEPAETLKMARAKMVDPLICLPWLVPNLEEWRAAALRSSAPWKQEEMRDGRQSVLVTRLESKS